MANNKKSILNFIEQNIPSVAIVMSIVLLIVPIPKILIDFSMILNIALSIIILLLVISSSRPSNFSSFPRIVLFATFYGLAINVTSTRLILTAKASTGASGYQSNQSAMVQAFSNIVAGNDLIIGLVIFIILIVVQIVVITKGAGRVSEVAARFTLDAMSTMSFDIDNQLSQGYITEQEAQEKKAELRRDISFYSNMDGSSKFVSGNVMAGVVITLANLIGGLVVGIVVNKLSFQESLQIYTRLTIGDGLLSQLPSLIISFATGILVTGDKSDETLSEKLKKEFLVDGNVYMITGAVLAIMGIGFRRGTQFLLIPIGGILIWYGIKLGKVKKQEVEKAISEKAEQEKMSMQKSNTSEKDAVAPLDPLQLQLGFALLPLVDSQNEAELLERIVKIRRECALDIGLPVPKIRVIDNMSLEPNEYIFNIKGIKAGGSKLRLGYYMCMNTGLVTQEIAGENTKDPTFGLPAIWIPEDRRIEAEQAGYAVVDPPTVIATHITEIIRSNAADILGRQEVDVLINAVKETNPIVVDEVLSGEGKMSYGEIEGVLKGLLREKVSIRNMVTILETLSNYSRITKNKWALISKVREALAVQICLQYADSDDVLRVVNLSAYWSEKILEYSQVSDDGSTNYIGFDPVDSANFIKCVSNSFASIRKLGYEQQPIIICAANIRQCVYDYLEDSMPGIVVLSVNEIVAAKKKVKIEILSEIEETSNGVL